MSGVVKPIAAEEPATWAFTPENRAKFTAGIPLGRFSKPSDIANAALFLADPASNFITGVAIEVDGGRCI